MKIRLKTIVASVILMPALLVFSNAQPPAPKSPNAPQQAQETEPTLQVNAPVAVPQTMQLGIAADGVPQQANINEQGGAGLLRFGADWSATPTDRSEIEMITIKADAPLNRVIAGLAQTENLGYVPYPKISEKIPDTTRIPKGSAINMINAILAPYGYRALVRNGIVEIFGKNIDDTLSTDVLIYKLRNISFIQVLKSPRQELGTSLGGGGGSSGSSGSSGGASSGGGGGGSSGGSIVEHEDLAAKEATSFFDKLGKIILSDSGRISFDPKSKTIVAKDLPPYLEMLRQYLTNLDKPQKSVLTKVKILSVNWNPERNQGIDYSKFLGSVTATLSQIPQASASAVTGATGTILGQASGGTINWPGFQNPTRNNMMLSIPDVSATLNLVRKYADIDSINELTLVTQESAPAHVFLGDQLFIVVPGTPSGASGVSSGPQTFQPEVGDMLTLGTNILPGDNIAMSFNLSSSRESTGREFSGSVYPQFHKQNIQQILEIPNDKTMILSGFMGDSVSTNRNDIPVLGSIPFLGPRLFGNSQIKRSRQTVLFLVTPSIINTTDAVAVENTTEAVVNAHKTNKDEANKYTLPDNAWRNPVSGLSDSQKRTWEDPTKVKKPAPPVPPQARPVAPAQAIPVGEAVRYDDSLTRSAPSLMRP